MPKQHMRLKNDVFVKFWFHDLFQYGEWDCWSNERVNLGNKMLYLCYYRRAGVYCVGRTRRPHNTCCCYFLCLYLAMAIEGKVSVLIACVCLLIHEK